MNTGYQVKHEISDFRVEEKNLKTPELSITTHNLKTRCNTSDATFSQIAADSEVGTSTNINGLSLIWALGVECLVFYSCSLHDSNLLAFFEHSLSMKLLRNTLSGLISLVTIYEMRYGENLMNSWNLYLNSG